MHGLNAKAGETHYFFINLVSGGGYLELFFTEVDPDQGKELSRMGEIQFIAS